MITEILLEIAPQIYKDLISKLIYMGVIELNWNGLNNNLRFKVSGKINFMLYSDMYHLNFNNEPGIQIDKNNVIGFWLN